MEPARVSSPQVDLTAADKTMAARPSVLRRRSFSFGACTVETACRVDGAVDAASAWQPGAHSSGGSVDPELEKRCAGLSTCEAPPHGTS